METTLGGPALVTGCTIGGAIVCGGAIDCGRGIVCEGAIACGGAIDCEGAITCGGAIVCEGAIACGGGIDCEGAITCGGAIDCGGASGSGGAIIALTLGVVTFTGMVEVTVGWFTDGNRLSKEVNTEMSIADTLG